MTKRYFLSVTFLTLTLASSPAWPDEASSGSKIQRLRQAIESISNSKEIEAAIPELDKTCRELLQEYNDLKKKGTNLIEKHTQILGKTVGNQKIDLIHEYHYQLEKEKRPYQETGAEAIAFAQNLFEDPTIQAFLADEEAQGYKYEVGLSGTHDYSELNLFVTRKPLEPGTPALAGSTYLFLGLRWGVDLVEFLDESVPGGTSYPSHFIPKACHDADRYNRVKQILGVANEKLSKRAMNENKRKSEPKKPPAREHDDHAHERSTAIIGEKAL